MKIPLLKAIKDPASRGRSNRRILVQSWRVAGLREKVTEISRGCGYTRYLIGIALPALPVYNGRVVVCLAYTERDPGSVGQGCCCVVWGTRLRVCFNFFSIIKHSSLPSHFGNSSNTLFLRLCTIPLTLHTPCLFELRQLLRPSSCVLVPVTTLFHLHNDPLSCSYSVSPRLAQ